MGAGTHNAYNTSLTHYHRVSESFAFSTGGFYDYEGGFFRNAALNNKKIDKGQSAGGRFRGIYLPSDNWKADLNVSYEYSDQGGYPYYYTGSVNPAAQSEEMKPYVGTISNNRESDYYRNLMNAGLNLEYQAQHFTLSAVTGYQFLKDRMSIDQDFTAKDIYTLEQKQRIHTLSEELVMKSKGNGRWQWATGVFGFYQWLKTDAPVTFRKDGMGMLNQMLGSVIPSKIEVTMMPGMGLNILPSLQLGGNDLLINGDFDTPLLNGALFHQSTFRDLFGLRGLSFTAGLRLDYEKMKDKLQMRICDKEWNTDLLADKVVTEHGDFAAYYAVNLEENGEGISSIPVTVSLMNEWGVSAEQIQADAMVADRKRGVTLMDMNEIIKSMIFGEEPENLLNEKMDMEAMENPMFCLTNKAKMNGASLLLQEDIRKQIGECLGSDYFVIPSSVHEVLILPDNGILQVPELNAMVQEVNETQVERQEQLSDKVQFCDKKTAVLENAERREARLEKEKAAEKAEVKGGIHGRLEKAKAEIKAKEGDKVPKNKSKELATAL